MNLYSHAGRAKSFKKDSRYPPLCTKRCATSCENLSNLLQNRKEKPEIQISKLEKISAVLGEITCIGIMLLQGRNSFPKDDFPIPLNYLDDQRQTKTSIMYFKRRPLMIIATLMAVSHCLNLGSVWHDSRCSAKIHQQDMRGFKSD